MGDRVTITVADQFSRYPAGRYRSDGPRSGEVFREDFLLPALRSHDQVIVNLDGAMGYGSSFLDEAFGGLVRSNGYTTSDLHNRLVINTKREPLRKEVWLCIDTAS